MRSDKKQPGESPTRLFANLDFNRRDRTGIAEAILAEGKSSEQVVELVEEMANRSGIALSTRISPATADVVLRKLSPRYEVSHNETGRTIVVRRPDYQPLHRGGRLAIVAAGTSDLPVAEEARVTAESMGCEVFTYYDVGIAGLHRLVHPLQEISEKDISVIVAVAGMEGALPSVLRGLVPVPVIGVPVSTGYGYGGKGEAALMTMLQSCAPGLTVVNIDNGFGAGATAALIASMIHAGIASALHTGNDSGHQGHNRGGGGTKNEEF